MQFIQKRWPHIVDATDLLLSSSKQIGQSPILLDSTSSEIIGTDKGPVFFCCILVPETVLIIY